MVNRRCVFLVLSLLFFLSLNLLLPSRFNGNSTTLAFDPTELVTNPAMDQYYIQRIHHPVFHNRPLTTQLQEWALSFLGIPLQLSFNLLHMMALLGIYFGLKDIGKQLFPDRKPSNIAFSIFLLSFPCMTGYLAIMGGYDDMIQWALLLIAIGLFLRKQFLGWMICFLLATICRETSLVFLPLFVGFYWKDSVLWKPRFIGIMGSLVILVLYVVFYLWIDQGEEGQDFIRNTRFTAASYNFGSLAQSFRSLLTVFVSLIPVWVLWRSKTKYNAKALNYYRIALLICWTHLLLLCFTAQLDEARLMMPSILLLFPLLSNHFIPSPKPIWLVVFIGVSAVVGYFIMTSYSPFHLRASVIYNALTLGYFMVALSFFWPILVVDNEQTTSPQSIKMR